MRDFNIHEPLEVQSARNKFDSSLFIKTQDTNSKLNIISSQLLYRDDISENARTEREDQLLYLFCESTHAYCALMNHLSQTEGLPETTKHFMELAIQGFKENAERALEIIVDVQEKYGTQNTWYPEFVKFGKWFLMNDQTVDTMELTKSALQSANASMEKIRSLEHAKNEGEEFDEKKFGEACQLLGEGKTMIESCLLPAMILRNESISANILNTAKRGFIDTFINTHNLESHLTPRGFMLSHNTLDKERKNYIAKLFTNIKALTNQKDGIKVMQKEGNIGTQLQVKVNVKDKLITATSNYTRGIHQQYDPRAKELKQAIQKTVSVIGSLLDIASDGYRIATGKGLGVAASTVSLQIDPNKKVEGDEKKVKPKTVYDAMAKKPEMEYNADGTENIAKYSDDLTKEHVDMIVELTKMAIQSANIEIGEDELNQYMDVLERFSKVGASGYAIFDDRLKDADILGALNACADIFYEYQDIDKLPKLDVEVTKMASKARDAIDTIVQTVEKVYWKEYNEEQEWLAKQHPAYAYHDKKVKDMLQEKGYMYDEGCKYTPATNEREER